MKIWVATRRELKEDFARMKAAHDACTSDDFRLVRKYTDARHPSEGAVPTYRIAFHHGDEPQAKIIVPTARHMYALMKGNYVRHKRHLHDDPKTGLPVFEGTNKLLPAMSEREAVEHLAWCFVPRGCNRWEIISTEDLPKTRVFRNAWTLQEAA